MPRERWTRQTAFLEVSENEAAALLLPLGSASIASLETLLGGHSNTNIRVRRHRADDVVLRLYQRDPAQARKEAAIAALIAGRVPAPRYLHVGERENGQTYAVVEWVDGAPLQPRVRGTSDEELARAGHDIGRGLAGIHSFTFDKAGFLGPDLVITPFPGGASNAGFLEQCFAGIGGERLGRDLAQEVIAYARANEPRAAVWNDPPRLTHFDFGSSNILVRDDFSLAGIVDWEFAAAASPAPDFGNLLRPPLGHSTAFIEALEEGYRDADGFLPDDWRGLTRLADMGAWAEFLSRPQISNALIEDARQILRLTVQG
ncbi:MAG: phosphotransferase [Alphaproteobacteria bacterium]|nr:phosphotransferase [Alphaproteobacteria bacterium]MBL6937062.1 phosphotransferase [Alphaproteobacteria bacterium]MBL7096376.1 phosphotransferase [Alphaproteobacteria bacterium]